MAADRESYRTSLGNDLGPERIRQSVWSQYIHRHTQKFFQLNLNLGHIHQCGVWGRVNQDVQIAAFLVFAMEHRAENPCVTGAVPLHNAANRCAVSFKGNRWFHRVLSKVDIQLGHISALMNTHS